MPRLFDAKLVKFVGVGLANTGLSAAVMFALYNWTHLGYWWSSAVAYVAGAIFSFIMNRSFTFRSRGPLAMAVVKFGLTVGVCYLLAFSVARPLVFAILAGSRLSVSAVEQVALLLAMCLYTGVNYLLQRFFVFPE